MSKRALQVVDQIEASASAQNWEAGVMLGDESRLMEDYDTGRSVLRQAVRLAEHLGIASMRRGRTGGLTVSTPTAEPVAMSLRIAWCQDGLVGRSVQRLDDRIQLWVPTAPDGGEAIAGAVADAAARYQLPLSSAKDRLSASNGEAKLGEQVAGQLLAAMFDEDAHDDVMGSEAELMKMHFTGRAALREAVHLLELHGAAIMQRGPGGGLLALREPSSGAIPRSLRAQLRCQGYSDQHICRLLESLLEALPDTGILPAGHALQAGASELIEELEASMRMDA